MRWDKTVQLTWTGQGLAFTGGVPEGPVVTVDSHGEAGPSPTDSLLIGLAACMGVDVVMILEKSRVPITGLEIRADATRAQSVPRYFTRISLEYHVTGVDPEDRGKLQRAVDLSRDKYCSVLHTLRPDLEIEIGIRSADP